MEKIAFKKIELEKSKNVANSERADYVGKFTDRLNETRTGKFKPLRYAFIGMKLSHLSLQDLHYLWNRCEEAKNFSAYFWWSLKPQDPTW